MSVEEMRKRVEAALEAELKSGFKLCCRSFGGKASGCALTATMVHENPGLRQVDAHAVTVWARAQFGQHQSEAFIGGFDDDAAGYTSGCSDYWELGKELRERYKPLNYDEV